MLSSRISFLAATLAVAVLVTDAASYPWHRNDVGYDPSLDPVMWSRAFTQDIVRRPRYMRTFQHLRTPVGDERDTNRFPGFRSDRSNDRFGRVQNAVNVADGGFGKRGRKINTNSWSHDYPGLVHRKRELQKSLYRNKFNVRGDYGVHRG